MNNYEVTNPTGITLHSGVLSLTKAQAASRTYALNNLGDGLYQVKAPVTFKRGEVFGYDGPLPKSFVAQMAEVGEAQTGSEKTAPEKKPSGKK